MTTRILIADDHRLFREGIEALLAERPEFELVGAALSGRQAIEMAERTTPDVVLLDVSMPDLNGIAAASRIAAAVPGARILALSMHADRRFVAGMVAAGASGYLLKDCTFKELLAAIARVAAGGVYFGPGVRELVEDDYVRRLAGSTLRIAPDLTPREREVLQYLAEGGTTQKIAARLGISPKTVETHRSNLIRKLGLSSVAELTKYAIREGLTDLEA